MASHRSWHSDVISHVLQWLRSHEVARTAAVSRAFYKATRCPSVWRHLDLSEHSRLPLVTLRRLIACAVPQLETLVLDHARHADTSLVPLISAARRLQSLSVVCAYHLDRANVLEAIASQLIGARRQDDEETMEPSIHFRTRIVPTATRPALHELPYDAPSLLLFVQMCWSVGGSVNGVGPHRIKCNAMVQGDAACAAAGCAARCLSPSWGCDQCRRTWCQDHRPNGGPCGGCGRVHCDDCAPGQVVKSCLRCALRFTIKCVYCATVRDCVVCGRFVCASCAYDNQPLDRVHPLTPRLCNTRACDLAGPQRDGSTSSAPVGTVSVGAAV